MREPLWMAGVAFVIALVLTPIIRDIFLSYRVVDRPGHRKTHPHPIPRSGGIAIAIAYGISLMWASRSNGPLSSSGLEAWQLIPAASVVLLTGLLDDLFSLKPLLKLAGLTAAASVAFWSGVHIGAVADHALPLWLDFPATVFWLLLTSNALNLIDGVDGLCAGMGFLASFTLFAAALWNGNLALASLTAALAGALLGFLCHNINPATAFLGDSGALLIGFLLGCYGMIWMEKASTLLSMLVPLLALSVPLLDVALSVLRRVLRHKPIFSADRDHIHHRLLDRGMSPRKAVLVLFMVGGLIAALGLLASSGHMGRNQGIFVAVFCIAAWLGIRKLNYAEISVASRLVFSGAFQRTMGAELQMSQITSALEAADNEDAWWEALVEAADGLGLAGVRWTGAHGERRRVLAEQVASAWSFAIPLSETDSVEIEGQLGTTTSPCDLVGFAAVVRHTFCAPQRTSTTVAKDVAGAPI
jgi:UDP-GlcNAc:undecaprenyl-phosphate GlcNAc-1-phosphate transferase